MWECKLAILATAGHPDPLLIQTIWTNIIDRNLQHSYNNKSSVSDPDPHIFRPLDPDPDPHLKIESF